MSTQEPTKPTSQTGTHSTTPASSQGQTVKPNTSSQPAGKSSPDPKLPRHGDNNDPRRLDVEAGKGGAAASKPGAAQSVDPDKKA